MPSSQEHDGGAPRGRAGFERATELDLGGTLAAAEAASPVESLDVVARMLRDHLHAATVSFLIVDFTGSSVVRLGAADSVGSDGPPERIALPGTRYGDVLRTQGPAVRREGDSRVRIVAPVTTRGDAIGLLELYLPDRPDGDAMRQIGVAAHALAYIVIANRSFTGVYQWGRRTGPLNLAAEIQHRLLPASLACEAAQFTVAAAPPAADRPHSNGDRFGARARQRRHTVGPVLPSGLEPGRCTQKGR